MTDIDTGFKVQCSSRLRVGRGSSDEGTDGNDMGRGQKGRWVSS